MDILVRPAVADDANALFRIHKDAIYELCAQDYTHKQITSWFPKDRTADHYADELKDGQRSYMVGVTNNIVASFCAYEIDGAECYISRFYTRPDYCGLGVGTKIFHAVEDVAKAAKCKKIILSSSITAHSFFEKMKMRTIDPVLFELDDGVELENFEMEKKVG